MTHVEHRRIGVIAETVSAGLKQTFAAIAANFPVSFEQCLNGTSGEFDALLSLGKHRPAIPRDGGRSIYCAPIENSDISSLTTSPVQFTSASETPWPFAGREIRVWDSLPESGLPANDGTTPVAFHDRGLLWTQRTEGNTRKTCVALAIPEFKPGEYLFQYFNRIKFLHLLPLLEFVRFVTRRTGWHEPRPRACLMFDDPNLHWRTYGYIDFEHLANHAAENNYHAAIATIPLDSWYAHPRAAQIYREHSDRVSILIHGNDHIHTELALPRPPEARKALVQQALERISHFEARYGLKVCRVMAPPHGACSHEMLAEMRVGGFEGASVSRFSLRSWNPDRPWLKNIGFAPADLIEGLPVISRFRMSAECLNSVLLAAYLGQPIIPVGHHEEAQDQMSLLAKTAAWINSLGKVDWMSMTEIVRSNFHHKAQSGALQIELYTRRAECSITENIRSVSIVAPRLANQSFQLRTASRTEQLRDAEPLAIDLQTGDRIEITCQPEANGSASRRSRALPLKPILRRQLTECRDRLKPFFRR